MAITKSNVVNERIILVTGVTRGLGKEMLKWFAAHPQCKTLIGVGRNPAHMEAIRKEFAGNPKVLLYELDVIDQSGVERLAADLTEKNLVPDLLMNSAGQYGATKPIWDITNKEIRDVFEVNVVGMLNFMRAFIPLMKEKKGAVIANMSSIAGQVGGAGFGIYCTSKFGIIGLTQCAALDVANTELAVVTMHPGVIQTDMLVKCLGEDGSRKMGVPMSEWVEPFCNLLLSVNKEQNGKHIPLNLGTSPI